MAETPQHWYSISFNPMDGIISIVIV